MIDVSDPASPVKVGEWNTSGPVGDLMIWGDRAYLAAGEELVILDISDPASPSFIASSPTRSAALAISVIEDFAYVGEDLYGLNIFDVSDVFNPSKLGSIYVTWGVNDVDVSGTRAYVATGFGGISAIDVSDPSAPKKADAYDAPGYTEKVFVDGGYAYLATDGAGLLVFKCDESKYQISGYIRESSGAPTAGVEVALSGDRQAATVTGETGFFAFSELESGDYVVTPSRPGWRFAPEAKHYNGLNLDMRSQDFTADVAGHVRVIGGEQGYIRPALGEMAKIEVLGGFSGTVTVGIYTLDGELVWERSSGISRGVESDLVWDCRDSDGDRVASGVYLVRVNGCGMDELRKVVVVR